MAQEDAAAFEMMQSGDPDKYLDGGAIEHSEYEMDMSPAQQEKFQVLNQDLFKGLYDADPLVDRENLPYRSFLENIDFELLRLRAEDYDETKAPRTPETIISQTLLKQADRHGGGVHALKAMRDMVLGRAVSE